MEIDDENKRPESDHRNGRGRAEGSRRSQFSRDNQPSRRRGPRRRQSLKSGLLEQLQQEVSVTVDGKRKKLSALDVLYKSMVQETLKAPLPQKLRFLEKLEKLGISAVQASQERLDRERRDFEEERQEHYKWHSVHQILLDGAKREAKEAQAKWYFAAKVLEQASSACTCGACDSFEANDISWLLLTFEQDKAEVRSTEEFLAELRELSRELEGDGLDDEEDDRPDGEEERHSAPRVDWSHPNGSDENPDAPDEQEAED